MPQSSTTHKSFATTDKKSIFIPTTVAEFQVALSLEPDIRALRVPDVFENCRKFALLSTGYINSEVANLHTYASAALFGPLNNALAPLKIAISLGGSTYADFSGRSSLDPMHTSNDSVFLVGEFKLPAKFSELASVNIVEKYNEYIDSSAAAPAPFSAISYENMFESSSQSRLTRVAKSSTTSVHQLYTYMKCSKVQYGLLSTLTWTWIFFLDDLESSDLRISQRFELTDCVKAFMWTLVKSKEANLTSSGPSSSIPTSSAYSRDEVGGPGMNGDEDEDDEDDGPPTKLPALGLHNSGSSVPRLRPSGSSTRRKKHSEDMSKEIDTMSTLHLLHLPRLSAISNYSWRVQFKSHSIYIKLFDTFKERHRERLLRARAEVKLYDHMAPLQVSAITI